MLWATGIEVPSTLVLASVLGICVGTALASYGEGSLNVLGLALMLAAEVAEATRLVLTQKLLKNLKFGVGRLALTSARSPPPVSVASGQRAPCTAMGPQLGGTAYACLAGHGRVAMGGTCCTLPAEGIATRTCGLSMSCALEARAQHRYGSDTAVHRYDTAVHCTRAQHRYGSDTAVRRSPRLALSIARARWLPALEEPTPASHRSSRASTTWPPSRRCGCSPPQRLRSCRERWTTGTRR